MSKQSKEQASLTPMLKQYFTVKSQYTDFILFFRLGDFYEMFYDDAVEASKILDIALTSRNKGEKEPVPLCGVPYHACQPYIAKLLAAGKKVAICEQVEDPKTATGEIKREVVRVITPGMVFDDTVLEAGKPNYLVCVGGDARVDLPSEQSEREGEAPTALLLEGATRAPIIEMAYLDISTGEFRAGLLPSIDTLLDELAKLDPKEILIPESWKNSFSETLKRHFPNALIHSYQGLHGASAVESLKNYVSFSQKTFPLHIQAVEPHEINRFLILDEAAQKNLELPALLDLLNETLTAMGARRLRRWLFYPLVEAGAIIARQKAIQEILDSSAIQEILTKGLKGMGDLERVVARISIGSANARDLVMLAESLNAFPILAAGLKGKGGLFENGLEKLKGFEPLAEKISKTIVEEPPFPLKEGGLIRDGIHPELDELRAIRKSGKNFIAALEEKERGATGVSSLKIRFNRVFGYYIEVTHTHREKIPPHYIRKQTLANAERYITPELKEYEEKVLGAEERIRQIEYELFVQLREEAAGWGSKIQAAAQSIADFDTLFALAKTGQAKRWTAPEIDNADAIAIEEGRHPLVEEFSSERFVPNDLSLDSEANRFLIITGPNMAGKSTVMRQTALIVILAQMGSFVPASKARIGLVDRIFTRVGALDRLSRGESTFMVEMIEVAHILKEATPKSLVILDEVGRGTSTYDGVAIAWAVAEYLHEKIKAKTLFATHYHELIDLPNACAGMKNFNIAVKEWNDQIIFLRKLVPGGTSKSYGVEVAKLAGLPKSVIEKAKAILADWEQFSSKRGNQLSLFTQQKEPDPCWKPILSELKALDLNQITPLQALDFLAHWKEKI